MRSISIFNNKGGVGKTTLSYHLGNALAGMGKKVLMIDADPQCNLTLYCLGQESIIKVWDEEQPFIDDFSEAFKAKSEAEISELYSNPRSLHFYLKPSQDGTESLESFKSKPTVIQENFHLIPGRLSFHEYEEELVFNWSGLFNEKSLSIRLATGIRQLIGELNEEHCYDYVIVDTSPSLGRLNRLIVSTTDIFVIPCTPDLFSLYGIKNIGSAIKNWKTEYDKLKVMLKKTNIEKFPASSSKFAGYVILNARKRSDSKNSWQLSKASYNYAQRIPDFIKTHIVDETGDEYFVEEPIGGTAIMHSHAGMTSVSQRHHVPMWEVPNVTQPSDDDYYSIMGTRTAYEATKAKYEGFAKDLEKRIVRLLGEEAAK